MIAMYSIDICAYSDVESLPPLIKRWQDGLCGVARREDHMAVRDRAVLRGMALAAYLCYGGRPLIDVCGMYQRLIDYWAEATQDDCYLMIWNR